MGAAFGKVTTAFVEGMFAPVVGLLMGGVNLAEKKTVIQEAVMDNAGKVTTPEVAIKWGEFITVTIDFLVVAFVMFMLIKAINNMKKKEAATLSIPLPPPAQEVLLTEIRDLLKK
ncbi:MAG TPA: large conductance mechanosensitive channel protein MscL, partial [Saprospiraceae bacterium]|nr:large conductance mechanosensitive channel protein MscL [Saprospiraceae bacterium]